MLTGGVLKHRDFRRLWLADALSQIGTQISFVALPLMASTVLHASTVQIALLRVADTVAFLLLSLPFGVWCDRTDIRPILIAADVGRALALLSLPVAALLGVLSMWQLYVVLFVAGAMTVLFDVAHPSWLPRLVGREHLVEANARLQTNMSVAGIVGPTAGGYLVQAFTAPVAVLVDAVSYLWSAAWLRRIRIRQAPRTAGKLTMLRDVREGIRFVFGNPVLRAIAFNGASTVLFQTAGSALFVVFLDRAVGLSAGGIGLLTSVGTVGALTAAFTARKVAAVLGPARALLVASALPGLGMLLLPLTYGGASVAWYAVGSLVSGYGVVAWNVVQVSFRQALCPDEMLGRMNATVRFMFRGAMPVGAALGAVMAAWLGVRGALWFAALGTSASALWLVCSPLRTMRDLPRTVPS